MRIPKSNAMDPELWEQEVSAIGEEIIATIAATLNSYQTPAKVVKALLARSDFYVTESDEVTAGERVWLGFDENNLEIGPSINPVQWRFYKEQGCWWYPDQEPKEGREPKSSHELLASEMLARFPWGNDDEVHGEKMRIKRYHRLAKPYLESLEKKLTEGDPTAADLRKDLLAFLTSCGSEQPPARLVDTSPGGQGTRLELRKGDELLGYILAVSPGRSLAAKDLQDSFDIKDSSSILIATDHLRFSGGLAGGGLLTFELRPPSQKATDSAAYYRGITSVVAMLDSAMSI